MAIANNNNKLGFIYLSHGKTLENVSAQSGDIIFYEDKHQIVVDGQVFGVTDDQATAISKIAGIETSIGKIESRVEMTTTLSKTILEILRETRTKLDGATLGGDGWAGAQSIQGIQGIQADNAVDAITALNTYINGIQTRLNNTVAGVASVNGQTGAVSLDGANLSTTSGAGEMFKNKTLDEAFSGVQSNIDGIQARITAEASTRSTAISGVQTQLGESISGVQTQLGESISGVQTQFNDKIGIGGNQSVKDYVDAAAAEALSGAQTTAKAYVDELAGTNWTDKAKTVQAIIDELSDNGNPDFGSFIDKVRGDYSYDGDGGNQSVKGYIDHAVGVAQTGAQTLAGTAETNAKDYTDTKIQGLDATATGTSEDNHVKVTVVEAAGKITNVNVVATDIASATTLGSVQTELAGAQGRIGAVETRVSGVEEQLKWQVV